jgi:hypothetical protein
MCLSGRGPASGLLEGKHIGSWLRKRVSLDWRHWMMLMQLPRCILWR